jgi:formylglycine-generating enzyme required for sulfatase activity
MRNLFFMLFAIIFPLSNLYAQSSCVNLFAQASPMQIQKMIAELSRLRLQLDLAQVRGLQSPLFLALQSEYKKKESSAISFLETNSAMSRDELLQRISAEILILQEKHDSSLVHADKRRDQERVALDYTPEVLAERAIFNKLSGGHFKRTVDNDQVDIEITKPFEMGVTHVTQFLWRTIIVAARDQFPGEFEEIASDPSNNKADDLPVEMVSFYDVEIWLNALNKLGQIDCPVLAQYFPGHKKNMIYRLPTSDENEFVLRLGGEANDTRYPNGNTKADLDKIAWYFRNSLGHSHPVATKAPVFFQGQAFYDLLGNVREWMSDPYHGPFGQASGAKNLQLASDGPYRLNRGGGWNAAENFISSSSYNYFMPYDKSHELGFRLVRTQP